MEIKNLNEALNIVISEELKFADFDVKGLYDTIKLEKTGSITFDEMNKIYDYLNIDKNTDVEELRAIRNTIVKYCADLAADLRPEQEKLSAEFHAKYPDKTYKEFMEQNPYDIMWDQMSAFTHAIDRLMYDKK